VEIRARAEPIRIIRGRMEYHDSGFSVHGALLAIAYTRGEVLQAHDTGDTQRAGEDRDMAGRAAAVHQQGQNTREIQADGLGGA